MSVADGAEGSALAPAQRMMRAAVLFAIDPLGLGGMAVRSPPGVERDRLMMLLRSLLMQNTTMLRVPAHVGDDRLLGGLDLGATLKSGRPVAERGLLAAADGGVIVISMAERMRPGTAALIAAALDTREVVVERDGFADRNVARISVVALDEGLADDEQTPAALLDRLAFRIDASALRNADAGEVLDGARDIAAARERLPSVVVSAPLVEALCSAAIALGIDSIRAPIFAVRAARASAALADRPEVTELDAAVAAQLVLAPRATVVPPAPAPEAKTTQSERADRDSNDPEQGGDSREPDEILVAAARAALPESLLDHGNELQTRRARNAASGRFGAQHRSVQHGRPAGVRRGRPAKGARLNVLATLRAAAPLQRLRAAENRSSPGASRVIVAIRGEDFHVTRYKQRSPTATIFVLDASGSSALHRLAEAKGAVELLLADCYVRRDQVAVVAFRNKAAEVLLPPTRSLVRARRELSGLPGGGGTPLAAGIDAGRMLAEALGRRGVTPTMVLLTDGRANVALDGRGGREQAQSDSVMVARRVRAAAIRAVLIDTSPRPGPLGQTLAAELGARYVPLPHADATSLARAVQSSAARAF